MSKVFVLFYVQAVLAVRKRTIDELALYGENDFVITYNGSLVQATKDNTIISRYTLSYEDF